ncbi:HlyC/CorC family transporter [Kineosporia sp. J2-2]|uniref:HlyC/CorC family transporter n=1 Tax=Kineosporia corallincola TaxID=2835133 RepID=A0ABS5TJT7_9ACTN|nr:hemolysin family protein [Kineosporia corallincola]MBT0770654.1 HlyC/CorC family transporter [Kineosporia corallincola]
MSNPIVVLVVTVALIALSAFFVAVEFALLAARRHRLEDAATTSRAARAALRSSSELTVLLAGSQLGITACTLALGAVTKPAVHHWLTPLFEHWGMGELPADVAGFVLALIVVTFLHLVVGEMAPKSWAIAHPETSAVLLALPMRAFMKTTRPLLTALNEVANWCLRRVGVDPAGQVASGRDPAALRSLVEHSASVGALEAGESARLDNALELESLTVGDLVHRDLRPTAVPPGSDVRAVREAALASGHLRILIGEGVTMNAVVHVRDTLMAPDDAPAQDLARPVQELPAGTKVFQALNQMRETRNHLAIVTEDGRFAGVITLADLLERLFPESAAGPAREAAPEPARTA